MKAVNQIAKFFLRFRYPVSLPEDIGCALGVKFPLIVTFDDFFHQLTSPSCHPTRLKRMMPRKEVEGIFSNAPKIERFQQNTLVSYYFNQGWIELDLKYGPNDELRRIYLHHQRIQNGNEGHELPLK
ncbi:MAG: hypothetical protein WD595_03640 [Waddliaceae bacterium]